MPNLGVAYGSGVTGWLATEKTPRSDKLFCKKMLGQLGRELELPSEELIDPLTVMSGSGPAYFFYLAEQMERMGVELGLCPADSRSLAEGTLQTTAALLKNEDISCEQWRQSICAAGGSTEAAILGMKAAGLPKAVELGMRAAMQRVEELGKD